MMILSCYTVIASNSSKSVYMRIYYFGPSPSPFTMAVAAAAAGAAAETIAVKIEYSGTDYKRDVMITIIVIHSTAVPSLLYQ